jgi:hypothetical protein
MGHFDSLTMSFLGRKARNAKVQTAIPFFPVLDVTRARKSAKVKVREEFRESGVPADGLVVCSNYQRHS